MSLWLFSRYSVSCYFVTSLLVTRYFVTRYFVTLFSNTQLEHFSNFLTKVEYHLFGRRSLNYKWWQFSFSRLVCLGIKFFTQLNGAHAMWLPTCYRFCHMNFRLFCKIKSQLNLAIIFTYKIVRNLIKQLFHSRLLDMRLVLANEARAISNQTRALGRIVKYPSIFCPKWGLLCLVSFKFFLQRAKFWKLENTLW